MAKTYWLPFQMPRSRFNNLPLRQLPLGSHLPYSQRSVLSDRQRWKCKLNRSLLRCGGSLYMIISARSIELDWSNLHSYWYSKCKILYFLHEMAWMRLWWSNYLVKQFFVGVNHVFSCILFTSMDSDLYSVCQQIFMAYNQRILTHGNWRIIINYEVASHRWLVTREMLIPPIICAEKVAANHINVDPC